MKKASVLILIALFTAYGVAAQSVGYVTFTDSAGKQHRHELADDSNINTYRPDGSLETGIAYDENGRLRGLLSWRPDKSIEATIIYENGGLQGLNLFRPDESIEGFMFYNNGRLRSLTAYQPNGNTKAAISYDHGGLNILSSTRPDGSQGAFIVDGICTQ